MAAVFAIVIGMVIGAVLQGLFGFMAGGLIGYLLTAVAGLHGRVRQLERALADRPLAQPAPQQTATAAPTPAATQHVAAAPPATEHPAAQAPPQPAPAETAAPAPAQPPTQPVIVRPPTPRPAPTPARDWLAPVKAWLSGGNLPVRLGVVILFFGVAFLLKFAADHSALPMELRLAGVALGGMVLLGFGWRLRKRKAAYGLVLQGGGVGVLYLTVFAGLRLYGLLPAELAFGLLVILALASSTLAVLQDSRSLASLSAAGGFLAPVLASTGAGSHVALFSYYALLNAGILGIAYFKAWRVLNLVGFFFTFAIATAWGLDQYSAGDYASTQPFLILFFLMYLAIAVLFALRQPPRLKGYVDSTLVFGVPIAGFALQAGMVKNIEFGLAWSALAMAAVYLGLARALWARSSGLRLLTEAFLALGVVFASLAVPLALSGHWTAVAWALEGAALIWVGVRQARLLPRLFGLLLQFGAGVAALGALLFARLAAQPVLNGQLLAALSIALAALFSGWYLRRQREALRRWERHLHWAPGLWGLAWWYFAGIREIDLFAPRQYADSGVLLFLAGSAVLAALLRQRLRWPLLLGPALSTLPVGGYAVLAMLESGQAHPFMDLGWLAWPAVVGAGYWVLRRLERDLPPTLVAFWHAGELWRLTLLLSWGCAYGVDLAVAGAGTWPLIAWAVVPALLVATLSRPLPGWPLAAHRQTYLTLGLGPLVVALWLWILVANLGSTGNPWPLPYAPLLNPLDLAQVFVLLAAIGWWRRARQAVPIPSLAFAAGLAATGFLWVNAALVRTVHHWADVPFHFSAMHRSVVLQASLSLLWSVLALAAMALAQRLGRRRVWFVGAGLMAVVVAKLFLVDLAGSGTVARIVSFIGVGVLLLVVGYLTPLPPQPSREQEA